MTATQVRVARTGPAIFLPLALIIVLLGVALAIAPLAPARATGGIYQVIIAERHTIPVESLSCTRNGDFARCTVPVGGVALRVTIHYAGFDSSCTATHGDRVVGCVSGLGATGHASHTVWISDNLGGAAVDPPPWWRAPGGPARGAAVLIAALTIAAALGTLLLGRSPRERTLPLRTLAAALVGGLGAALLGATGSLLGDGFDPTVLISPVLPVAALSLAFWQYHLAGPGTRRTQVVGAAVATAVYTASAAYLFLQQSGFMPVA